MCVVFFCFFFSSRRRHTRLQGDWSSDVCSSDLEMIESGVIDKANLSNSKVAMVYGQMNEPPGNRLRVGLTGLTMAEYFRDETREDGGKGRDVQIGRASCRERV